MKNITKLVLILIILALISGTAAYAKDNKVHVIVEDRPIKFPDEQPFISDYGRTMVPIRFVAETLNMEVYWVGEDQTVILKEGSIEIKFKIGELKAYVNGIEKTIDYPAVMRKNRTYVPLRFISEVLGHRVEWKDKIKAAVIYKVSNNYGQYMSTNMARDSALKNKIEEILSEIIKPGMSEYEKVLAIHDYIVLNTEYDYLNYPLGTVPTEAYLAEGALLDQQAQGSKSVSPSQSYRILPDFCRNLMIR